MDRSGLKPSIQPLASHAAEQASLPERHHRTAANWTPRGSRFAHDENRLCSGPDGGSSGHVLNCLRGIAVERTQHGGNARGKSLAQAWKILGFSWRLGI